jgi:hypothetical protein
MPYRMDAEGLHPGLLAQAAHPFLSFDEGSPVDILGKGRLALRVKNMVTFSNPSSWESIRIPGPPSFS